MIIDFHTHIYPDVMADKVIARFKASYHGAPLYTEGTQKDLKRSMREAGITHAVILPVLTNPLRFEFLNTAAKEAAEKSLEEGPVLIPFGGIHPDSEDYKAQLRQIRDWGFKGIKLHPYDQAVAIDDIRNERIIDYAGELGLITLVHCGFAGYPAPDYCVPENILRMIDDVHPEKLVLAHMGGNGEAEKAEELLVGGDFYFDTAYCMDKLPPEQFVRMVRAHGVDKVLFGTDSPWSDQKAFVDYIHTLGFTDEELDKIMFGNAESLLGGVACQNK